MALVFWVIDNMFITIALDGIFKVIVIIIFMTLIADFVLDCLMFLYFIIFITQCRI